ncbi:QcrA and Rieske domain-containing protein [Pseudochryseolinea flava]|uniref:Rieske (2Fe-2S) iron-sulfur domain-containing protein n=1 Tax=Pseudochryseolinea flava TaxID=2059302 RepID=A0A364XUM6_9BACT|nr:Rieske (2Fe-2S) protein [Pseudochryseolinea flava]RAV97876.1 Rieske (2Fe-2S) iron-sulfur domain-containing protein [Pseudochryseolinea flava]
MNRRQFTKTCLSCISWATLAPLAAGCSATHYTSGTIETNGISIMKTEFDYMNNNDEVKTRSYVLVRNEAIEFPIYVYRFSDQEYSAVLMKCTHQGNELSAAGDHLTCSAHGSEFTARGTVAQGPAERNLRSFNVHVLADKIFIDLSA